MNSHSIMSTLSGHMGKILALYSIILHIHLHLIPNYCCVSCKAMKTIIVHFLKKMWVVCQGKTHLHNARWFWVVTISDELKFWQMRIFSQKKLWTKIDGRIVKFERNLGAEKHFTIFLKNKSYKGGVSSNAIEEPFLQNHWWVFLKNMYF